MFRAIISPILRTTSLCLQLVVYYRPERVKLIWIINKPILLHLVGCLYYCILSFMFSYQILFAFLSPSQRVMWAVCSWGHIPSFLSCGFLNSSMQTRDSPRQFPLTLFKIHYWAAQSFDARWWLLSEWSMSVFQRPFCVQELKDMLLYVGEFVAWPRVLIARYTVYCCYWCFSDLSLLTSSWSTLPPSLPILWNFIARLHTENMLLRSIPSSENVQVANP